jgi:thymidylate synthase
MEVQVNNTIDNKYISLINDIFVNGHTKDDRTGTGTISKFGTQIRHNMSEGFPLLTTKKMAWKQIVTELIWFLRGDTNIKYLVDNKNYIWVGDAYKAYVNNIEKYYNINKSYINESDKETKTKNEYIEFIKNNDISQLGELGRVYGYQLRNWNGNLDQIKKVYQDIKSNPDNRRLLVTMWNPSDLPMQALPPCHHNFQLYTRNLNLIEKLRLIKNISNNDVIKIDVADVDKILFTYNLPSRAISLLWSQRSVDVGLGLPFNIASYGLLLLLFAKQLNMVADELIFNGGDTHLYLNHLDQLTKQLKREPYNLPTVDLVGDIDFVNNPHLLTLDNFKLVNYVSHDKINLPLSN